MATFVGSGSGPIDVGSRLELLVDDALIARLGGGAKLRLNHPVPGEVALVLDQPWEGNACGHVSVFRDGDLYRMYYRGCHFVLGEKLERPRPEVVCYAESEDGIHWKKPELGLVEFDGSKRNNIILDTGKEGCPAHCFVPFKDDNPDAKPDARYKAWGRGRGAGGLYPFKSPDGIHWTLMSDEPAITYGAFDSQNVAFWDKLRGEYRDYHRNRLERGPYTGRSEACAAGPRGSRDGRDILTATSQDFVNWTESVYINYTGGRTDELYTNAIIPYYRAPHILVGFPMRYIDRGWTAAMEDLPEVEHRRLRSAINERYGTALTDTMFLSSRDRLTFKLWPESFIRPGLRPQDSWTYADACQNRGIVETPSAIEGAPDELSFYLLEGYWRGESTTLRRYTLRVDGFVSVSAPLSGGELVTKPLVFSGSKLALNFSASAAGSIRVEILRDQVDTPVEGFTLADCIEVLGDDLARVVRWTDAPDLGRLAGVPVRLRFVLRDADLFSLQFTD